MPSNIGYDVGGGQFDIMIPGGGVGQFNGCAQILGSNLGKTYGGLLSDCEDEVGWNGSDEEIYEKRKSCLTQKCKKYIVLRNLNVRCPRAKPKNLK